MESRTLPETKHRERGRTAGGGGKGLVLSTILALLLQAELSSCLREPEMIVSVMCGSWDEERN